MLSRFHPGGSRPPRPPSFANPRSDHSRPLLSRQTPYQRDCFRAKANQIEYSWRQQCAQKYPHRSSLQTEAGDTKHGLFNLENGFPESMKRAQTIENLKGAFKIHAPRAGKGRTFMRRTISLNDYVTIYQTSNQIPRERCLSRASNNKLQALGIKGSQGSQAGVIHQDRFKPEVQVGSLGFGQSTQAHLGKKKVSDLTLLAYVNLDCESRKGSPRRKGKIRQQITEKSSPSRLRTAYSKMGSSEKRIGGLHGKRKLVKSQSECMSAELYPQCRGIKGGAVNYIKKEKRKAALMRSTPYFIVDSKEVKKQRANQNQNKFKQFVQSLKRNEQLKKADEVINQYRKVMHRLLSDKDFITSKEYLTSHQYLESPNAAQDAPIVITKSVFNNRVNTTKPNLLGSPKQRSPSNQSLLEYDSDQFSIKNSTRPITQITITEQSKSHQPSSFCRQSSAGSLQKKETGTSGEEHFDEYKSQERRELPKRGFKIKLPV